MTGDERVRFCDTCERPVYNLSAMTGHEIATLIRETEGRRPCVRFYQRADGTTLTRDCPVGFRAARRRAMGLVATGAAALFGGMAAWFGGALPLGGAGRATMGEAIMGDMMIPEDEQPAIQGRIVLPPEDVDILPEAE